MTEPTEDPDFDAFAEEYEEHRDALYNMVSDYADEHEMDDALLTGLLLDLAVTTRMVVYANSVEKPSAGGLRLELDRLLKDVTDHLREVKKDAEGFIAEVKAQSETN
jgi:hypothetical protein